MSYSEDNDRATWIGYNRAKGFRASYLENWIPETNLSTEENALDGASAAKLLVLAQQNGQRVFTLTSANAAELANIQIDDDARRDILNALSAGKEVTVHEAPITLGNWTGTGYFVIDPFTGAGGYLISGGSNGSWLSDVLMAFAGVMMGMGSARLVDVDIARKISFSPELEYRQRLARILKFTGFVGLFVSFYLIYSAEGFTWKALGRASVALLGFALTAAAIVGLGALVLPGVGVLAIGVVTVVGGLLAAAIGFLAFELAELLFA